MLRFNKKIKIISLIFLFLLVLIPTITSAQNFPGVGFLEEKVGFLEFIESFHRFALGIGGILAVGMIVVGAIYISASGAIDKQSEGKSMITSAILGLALLFGSTLILRTLNPQLAILTAPHMVTITFPADDQQSVADLCKTENFESATFNGRPCSVATRNVKNQSILLTDGNWITITGTIQVALLYNLERQTVSCEIVRYKRHTDQPSGGAWREDVVIKTGFNKLNRCN